MCFSENDASTAKSRFRDPSTKYEDEWAVKTFVNGKGREAGNVFKDCDFHLFHLVLSKTIWVHGALSFSYWLA